MIQFGENEQKHMGEGNSKDNQCNCSLPVLLTVNFRPYTCNDKDRGGNRQKNA